MRALAILTDWLDELSCAFNETSRWGRGRRAVTLKQEDDRLVARRANDAGPPIAAAIGERFPNEALETLRTHVVSFELGAADFAVRTLNVPSQAKDVLAGIVHNQLDRLSPWPAANIVYGFDAAPGEDGPKSLNVRVLISPRKTIEAVRRCVSESGLLLDQVVAAAELSGAGRLTLWTRPAATRGARFGSPRMVAAVLAGLLIASVATTVWAALSASAVRAEQAEIVARIDAISRHVASRSAKTAAPSRNPAEQAWILKETSPTAVAILEALTEALPDSAYLTELSLEREKLRVTGFAADPPPLIAALSKSDRFSAAHFFAATTKNPEGGLYKFAIEAQVMPAVAESEMGRR